jgi:hypothetical protein
MKNTSTISTIARGSELRLTDLKGLSRFPHSFLESDRLQKLWNYLVAVWWYSEEPRITQKQDKSGNWIYRVYDPITHQHLIFDSEQEVRIWLEERYYQ